MTETEPVSEMMDLKTAYNDEQCPEIKIIMFMTTHHIQKHSDLTVLWF
jgi:hypothetical protein